MAVQESPTSIRVSWNPSSDGTGYIVHYVAKGNSNESVIVNGGSTSSCLLTGLQNGAIYTVYIKAIGTSTAFPSPSVVLLDIGLGNL